MVYRKNVARSGGEGRNGSMWNRRAMQWRVRSRPLMILFSLIFLICAMAGSPVLGADSRDDVRVVSMSPSQVIVELILPEFSIERVQGPDGEAYARVHVPGWGATARPGYPELPFKRVLLSVPQQGAEGVEILEDVSESTFEPGVCPVPRWLVSDEGEAVSVFFKDTAAYDSPGFYPEAPATLGSLSVLRGVPAAPLDIHPFQWNPATGELKYHRRIRLAVHMGGTGATPNGRTTGSPSPSDPFESLKKRTLINHAPGTAAARRIEAPIGPKPAAPPDQALRLEVPEAGIYRLTYEDMAALDVPPGIDPQTFQLFNGGNEVAIHVTAAGDVFGPGDTLLFYGQAVDTRYTGTNVYFLRWGQGTGLRMGEIDGTVTGTGTSATVFDDVLHVEENHILWESMPGAPELDFWFREKLTAPQRVDYALDIPSPDPAAGEAVVRVAFQGRSTSSPHPNHHTVVRLNDVEIGNAWWDGAVSYVMEAAVPQTLLGDGTNIVSIDLPGDTGAAVDIVYVDWMEVAYTRLLKAVEDALEFTVAGDGRMKATVTGWSDPDVRLLNVTDPAHPEWVTRFTVEPDGAGYRLVFEDEVHGVKSYLAAAGERTMPPLQPTLWRSAGLKRPENGADWILVTGKDMIDAVQPLARLREARGLRVKVVSMADVYDEFNFGLADPSALKSFLQYAYESWSPPAPTYVFLLGDATIDYRDWLGSGKKNIVPPHLSLTSLGATPEDNWYVCMDGPEDVLPDMFIGRMPANGPDMARTVIDKIVGFESSPWPVPERVLLAADNNEATFENLNESMVPYLPPEVGTDRVYLGKYADVEAATADIVSYLNAGAILAHYVGHGSVTNWSGEYLFDSEDVPFLSNADRLTFVVAMTCLNGYFAQPFHYCLAEELTGAPGKGAVASFAPGGLGFVWEHELLDTALFSNLFENRESVVGPAAMGAKIAAYGKGATEDVLRTFTLFGDPAVRLKISRNDGPLIDIRANGLDGPVRVLPSENVKVTVSLVPGAQSGRVCDWWLSAGTPSGTCRLDPQSSWSCSTWPLVLGTAGLFEISSASVPDMPLPAGIHTFAFGLDARADGIVDGLDWYDYVNVISAPDGPSSIQDVVPNVQADSRDTHLDIESGRPVKWTLSLDPGSQAGLDCDWWIGASTPFGTFWYDLASGWQASSTPRPTFTGGLFQVKLTELLDDSLPAGIYTFFFILDRHPDGTLDDISWFDLVNVVCR